MTETRAELGCVLGVYAASPSWATSELTRSSFLSRSPDEAFPGGLGCGSGSGHYTLEWAACAASGVTEAPCEKAEKEAKLVTQRSGEQRETVKPFDLNYGYGYQLKSSGKEGSRQNEVGHGHCHGLLILSFC